jgi:hypothetical protein
MFDEHEANGASYRKKVKAYMEAYLEFVYASLFVKFQEITLEDHTWTCFWQV